MHVHNTGQGSAVFFKNGKNALIVDFGAHQTGKYRFKTNDFDMLGRYRPIYKFLENVDIITVVITHNHFDHHSLLQNLPEAISSKIHMVYVSDYGDGSTIKLPFSKEEISKKFKSVLVKDDIPIQKVLGNDVDVFPILPITWPTTGKSAPIRSMDSNDNSIVVVVQHGVSKILLTGDATGATFNEVQKVDDNKNYLKNITFILFSHHGSIRSGAFEWFHYVKENVDIDFHLPLVTVISSDPTENDYLPHASVCTLKCSRPGNLRIFPAHKISTEDGLDNNINEPIYVTGDARGGFFRMLFAANGNLELFDGEPKDSPDLLRVAMPSEYISPADMISNYENLSPEKKKENLKKLLKNIGAFSTQLSDYIKWITEKITESKDEEILILAINNLSSFTKDTVMQQSFINYLLCFLDYNINNISENLVLNCLVNQRSLFLYDKRSAFSHFLYGYFSRRQVSLNLAIESLKHLDLFKEKVDDFAQLLLKKLADGSSYEDWQKCMKTSIKYVRHKEFLNALVDLMPNE